LRGEQSRQLLILEPDQTNYRPNAPTLLLAPAERADLIIDFSEVPPGSRLILYNDAPAPFPGPDERDDYYPGNPKNPTRSTPGYGPLDHRGASPSEVLLHRSRN
jgi:hypothetical protein